MLLAHRHEVVVIRVVDQKTEEVVSQIPAEYVLRLSKDLAPKSDGGR